MARRKADSVLDLTRTYSLSAGLIAALRCPQGRTQAFLRDSDTKGLRVRVTAAGAKSFVFEAKVNGKTLRQTIGDPGAWTIEAARIECNRLRVLVDQKQDPREIERQKQEQAAAAKQEARARAEADIARAVTVGEVWTKYLAERRPHWGERNYADHLSMTDEGGKARSRLAGVRTKPGPLAPLMALRLMDLDAKAVETWAIEEAKSRPARVRLALRLLKAFLRWAASEPKYAGLVDSSAASARKAREAAGKAKEKKDVLERGQLVEWFSKVRSIGNPVIAAYLQVLLLTGARPGEVLTLRWADVNTRWKGLTIRDKVEGERTVPLTPYVHSLLAALPRRRGNPWVFSSPVIKGGRMSPPTDVHRRACASVGLEVSFHGLRRSFKSLTEWLEVPVGVVAQVMGHKPSATAEKHYTQRPLDLLRVHHERIEAWILEQGKVPFDASGAAHGGLHLVQGDKAA